VPRLVVAGVDLIDAYRKTVAPADPQLGYVEVDTEDGPIIQATWPGCVLRIPASSKEIDHERLMLDRLPRAPRRPEEIDWVERVFTQLCELPSAEALTLDAAKRRPVRLPSTPGARRRSYSARTLLWAREALGAHCMYQPHPRAPIGWSVVAPTTTFGWLFVKHF